MSRDFKTTTPGPQPYKIPATTTLQDCLVRCGKFLLKDSVQNK